MREITFNKAYKIIEKILPRSLLSKLKKTESYRLAANTAKKILPSDYKPSWQTINVGPLKGCQFYVDLSIQWQREMLQGIYDVSFFEFLDKQNMTGKTAYDIGSHLGLYSLYFARKVGPTGSVYSFEPNPTNILRLKMILERNSGLSKNISMIDKAVSDKTGSIRLMCTDVIDDGSSTGGYIEGSDTVYKKSSYEGERGFRPVIVETISLDQVVESGKFKKPDYIKMDIEGAEFLAINGALSMLKKCSPILLIEIHSKFNLDSVSNTLKSLGYEINILRKEAGDRCFIIGSPKK